MLIVPVRGNWLTNIPRMRWAWVTGGASHDQKWWQIQCILNYLPQKGENFDQIKVQRRIFSGSFIEIRYTVVEVTLNQRNLIWADMFETKKRQKRKKTKCTAASNLDCSTVYWTTWLSQVTENKLMRRMSWEKRNWCMLVEGLSKRGIELPGGPRL